MIVINTGAATNARRGFVALNRNQVGARLQVLGGAGASSDFVKSAATCSSDVGMNRFATIVVAHHRERARPPRSHLAREDGCRDARAAGCAALR